MGAVYLLFTELYLLFCRRYAQTVCAISKALCGSRKHASAPQAPSPQFPRQDWRLFHQAAGCEGPPPRRVLSKEAATALGTALTAYTAYHSHFRMNVSYRQAPQALPLGLHPHRLSRGRTA